MSTLKQTRIDIFNRNLQKLESQFQESIRPPEDYEIWEWAEKNRIIPKGSSPEPGPFRIERVPFMKEIMQKISPQDPTQEIVLMKGSQISGTESTCINPLLYYIDHAPCPILYVQKTLDAVKKFSRQRLGPSIREVPSIKKKIGDMIKWGGSTSRENADTMLMKSFPGGVLILGGANSAASLRSTPIQILLMDEVDSFEANIDEEGDPVSLAIRRTANFSRRKIIYCSTPVLEETSRIEPLYESGTQKKYFVPCPYCKFKQTIMWDDIKWEGHNHKTAYMLCRNCAKHIEERWKTQMLAEGEWIAAEGCEGRERESYHLSALYSPLGWHSWQTCVKDFLEAKAPGQNNLLQTFVNTTLGETWSRKGVNIEYTLLERRREIYAAEVPEPVLLLTAGVDVQENRIEVEVVGWGMQQENWSIDYKVIYGDTESDDVWIELYRYLTSNWRHTSGQDYRIACTAIDSGHRARRVYQFCKPLQNERMFPIKGRAGWGKGLIERPKRPLPMGVYLFGAWVDELKSKVYSQLTIDKSEEWSEGMAIPGYCHFPIRPSHDSSYFQMLVSEQQRSKQIDGQQKWVWYLPPGRRNEVLDCRAYSIAALNILNPNFDIIAENRIRELSEKKANIPEETPQMRVGVISRGVEL